MKKKLLSIFVIVVTSITVFIMLQGLKEKDSSMDSNLFKENSPKVNSLNTEEKGSPLDITKDEGKDSSHENDEEEMSLENMKDSIKEEQEKQKEALNQEDLDTAPVFKVHKDEIKDIISLDEKSKLLFISRKLSMMDYGKILEIMKSSDEMNSASEIFQILKARLSEEDYAKVKKILEPYMYVDNIENHISKSKN